MKNETIATPFVSHVIPELQTLRNSKVYLLREKLNKGEKLQRAEKDWIAQNLNSNTFFKNAVPLMGYRFDFSDILRKFLVKQYGNWHEYNAPDRTSLRSAIFGRIDKIVEIAN